MSSLLGINMTQNVSLLTVPAVLFFSCMAPHMYATGILSKGAYDNASPRSFRDNVTKSALAKAVKERIFRAESASQNGFESLGFYAGAVLAGNMAGLATKELNALSLGYLASRLGFVVVYIHLQANRRWASLRSFMWGTGTILAMSLWVRAGLAVMRAG